MRVDINYGELLKRYWSWLYLDEVGGKLDVVYSDLQFHCIYNTRFDIMSHLRIMSLDGHDALVAHGDSLGEATSPKWWKISFTYRTGRDCPLQDELQMLSPVFEGNVEAFDNDLALLTTAGFSYTADDYLGESFCGTMGASSRPSNPW